jgi:hypothetical protein
MGELKRHQAHPNVNVTLAVRDRRKSPRTETSLSHILRDSAPVPDFGLNRFIPFAKKAIPHRKSPLELEAND